MSLDQIVKIEETFKQLRRDVYEKMYEFEMELMRIKREEESRLERELDQIYEQNKIKREVI